MQERDILSYCLELVAAKASADPVKDWTDGNFIELSEAILDETGILISRNTLKRLYGKMKTSEEYKPQKETKNALANFAGFPSWSAFKASLNLAEIGGSTYVPNNPVFPSLENPNFLQTIEEEKKVQKSSYRWLLVFFLLLVGLILVGYWQNSTKEAQNSTSSQNIKSSFYLQNPIDTVPFTLTCRYSFEPEKSDSFFINKDNAHK